MIAVVIYPADADDVHVLDLEPQTPLDQRTLRRLASEYQVAGLGRHPDTGDLLHVQLTLQPKEEPDAADV